MNDSVPRKYDLSSFGIEAADSCPCCKRLLSSMLEDNEGGALLGKSGEWVCSYCGVMFVPRSRMRKVLEALKEQQKRVIVPKFVPPPGLGKS